MGTKRFKDHADKVRNKADTIRSAFHTSTVHTSTKLSGGHERDLALLVAGNLARLQLGKLELIVTCNRPCPVVLERDLALLVVEAFEEARVVVARVHDRCVYLALVLHTFKLV